MGRVGGLARVRLHGNPGTTEGRRLGGLHSLKTHRARKTGFKMLRPIVAPAHSVALAELLGILAGDGHIGEYQATVTTNSLTDMPHALHVQKLFSDLFGVMAPISLRKGKNACAVVVSSREVGRFLVTKGMPKGNKIREGLCMPLWVKRKRAYRHAFLKGLFDTDGCVYVDRHTHKGRIYKNIGMAFTNRSLPLLADFKAGLETLGLHPTQKTKYTVFLRREKEIELYFNFVGSSNPKHAGKVSRYFAEKRRGVRVV